MKPQTVELRTDEPVGLEIGDCVTVEGLGMFRVAEADSSGDIKAYRLESVDETQRSRA